MRQQLEPKAGATRSDDERNPVKGGRTRRESESEDECDDHSIKLGSSPSCVHGR